MAVSLLIYPPQLALAKNPMVFKFSSNGSIATAGSAATLSIAFNAGMVEDDWFELTWSGRTVRFTAKDSPDDSGLQTPSIQTMSINTWVMLVAQVLYTNYYLAEYFIIISATNVISLTAKVNGIAYDIDVSGTNTTGVITNTPTAGADDVPQDFFSIILQTFMTAPGGSYEKKFEDALSLDTAFNAYGDISEIVKAELFSEFEFPEVDPNCLVKRYNMVKPYYIRYAEQYGIPIAARQLQQISPQYALNGGVPFWKQKEYADAGTSFWDRMQYDMIFLTWMPNNMKIDPAQVVKLYFLVWNPAVINATCGGRCTFHLADGSTAIHNIAQGMNFMDVWEIECGYAALNAKFDFSTFSAAVLSYDIAVTFYGNDISESRTFIVDTTEYPNFRQFLFKNSLGGYDSLRITGIGEFEQAEERAFITESYPKEFSVAWKQRKQVSLTGSIKMKVNSGWKTKEEIDWMQDFMLSDEVYEIIDDKIFPVVITSTSGPKHTDEQTPAYFMEFEYERSHQDNTWAKPQYGSHQIGGIIPVPGGNTGSFDNSFEDSFDTNNN